MAQKVQILLIDDLDGGEATETISFALDGVHYEIDLSGDNAEKLRAVVEPYADSARRVAGRKQAGTPRAGGHDKTAEIRAWAKQRDIEVGDKGRIPRSVVQQYETAQRAPQAPAKAATVSQLHKAAKTAQKPAQGAGKPKSGGRGRGGGATKKATAAAAVPAAQFTG